MEHSTVGREQETSAEGVIFDQGSVFFCLHLLGVAKSIANTMDRTQWFTIELGSSSLSMPTQYAGKVAYKT